MRDLYADLDVQPTVSPEELRKQYRKLAMKWHPDRHVGQPTLKDAEVRFQHIQAAYHLLSDPTHRAAYDREKRAATHRTERYHDHDFDDLDQWYQDALKSAQRAGPADYAELLRDFELGGETYDTQLLSVPFSFADQGVTGVLNGVNVRVPPASREGTILTTASGQKYRVQITYPSGMSREKDDVVLAIDLPLTIAILGGTTQFSHWDKRVLSVSWPPNSYTGKRLRLRGCGALLANGMRGDLFLQSNVVFQNFNPLEIEGIKKLLPTPEILQISPKWDT